MKSQNLLTKYKPPKMFSTKKMYRSQRVFNQFFKVFLSYINEFLILGLKNMFEV